MQDVMLFLDLRYTTMALSLVCILLSYVVISRRTGSWLNWATLWCATAIGGDYILQAFWMAASPTSGGSSYAYAYCYATYGLQFIVAAGAYVAVLARSACNEHPTPTVSPSWQPWTFLIGGVLLYLPVVVAFHQYLGNPRQIYEQTRTGYGLEFFGSSALALLGFVFNLFVRRQSISSKVAFCFVCSLLIYLHGSKGQLLFLLIIWILYRVHVKQQGANFLKAVAAMSAIVVTFVAAFALFADVNDMVQLGQDIEGYADYTRNAMKVIDDPDGKVYYGQLTIENNLYAYVPRVLWPGKPKNFGGFVLAQKYFPEWFAEDTGSPAFGIGTQYADFGDMAFVPILLSAGLTGALAGLLTNKLRQKHNPAYFVLLLCLSGIAIVPLGGSSTLPEAVIVTTLSSFVLRLRLRSKVVLQQRQFIGALT